MSASKAPRNSKQWDRFRTRSADNRLIRSETPPKPEPAVTRGDITRKGSTYYSKKADTYQSGNTYRKGNTYRTGTAGNYKYRTVTDEELKKEAMKRRLKRMKKQPKRVINERVVKS